MSKFAAAIRFGWLSQVLEGDSPCAIMRQIEEIQDFGCLMGMGRRMEGPEGQKELPSVERIAKLFGFPVEEIREHLDYMGRKDILPETK